MARTPHTPPYSTPPSLSEQVTLLVPPPEMAEEISRRLRPFVPLSGHDGGVRCDPDFVNRRWRVYRYLASAAASSGAGGPDGSSVDASSGSGGGSGSETGDSSGSSDGGFFRAHHDAAQPRSAVRDGELVDDEPPRGSVRLSQMSVLLYLTGGHAGGHTVFHPSGEVGGSGGGGGVGDGEGGGGGGVCGGGGGAAPVRVAPRKGAALCFWHGRHPLSPLHEGAPLEHPSGAPGDVGGVAAPKIVIRTDVLYATEPPVANSDSWTSSSYAAAMLHATKVMG